MKTITDPMELLIANALGVAGVPYLHEADIGRTPGVTLDFELPDNIFIEVKRMHSDRIGRQMAQVENVIVAQGKEAVLFLARAIEGMKRS